MISNNQKSIQQTNNNNNTITVNGQQQSKNVQKFDSILVAFNHNRKIDRVFYEAVKNFIWYNNVQCVVNFIRLLFLLSILIFGLASNSLEENIILAFVVVALCATLLQFSTHLLFRICIFKNYKVLMKIANRSGHLTNQPITQNIKVLENCVSSTMYNQQFLQNIAYYENISKELRQCFLISAEHSFQNNVKKTHQGLKYFKNFCQLVELASFIFGVLALSLCQTTPKLGMLIPIIIFLIIQGLYKIKILFYFVAILLIIGLSPIILIVNLVLTAYRQFYPKTPKLPKKFRLPQPIKSTQQMINQAGRNCSICFQSFTPNKKVIQLRCSPKHIYHPLCIKAWSKVKSSCPICRAYFNGVNQDSVRNQFQV